MPSLHRHCTNLCGGDSLALALSTLAAGKVLVTVGNIGGLSDSLLSLSEDELDVAWVGHVWVDLGAKSVKRSRTHRGVMLTRP